MDIIGHRKIFYVVSGLLIALSLAALAAWDLKLGIDFTGGSLIEVEFSGARPSAEELAGRVRDLGLGEVRLQPTGDKGLFLRARHMSEAEHQAVLDVLAGGEGPESIEEKRFDTVGPTIGRELQQKSLIAVVLVILLIVSYIAFAFRKVSLPVASWKYGVATIIALVHDVVIPVGLFAVAGRFAGFEVDTLFITAILTVLGFSVHDTIVVFDRIRENLAKTPRSQLLYGAASTGQSGDFETVVNQSVNETLTRSVNTSLTVVLALAAVYFFGGASTKIFSLTLIIGIFVGTYSSIFIASPVLVTWHKFKSKV